MQSDEKYWIEKELKRAASFLPKWRLKDIIPPEGLEIVYAASRARTPEMVGRIILTLDQLLNKPNQEIQVSFGDPGQLTSGILTAMRFSPEIRSSCSLKNSNKIIKICEEMLLYVCRLDAFQVPPGVTTMDWAVAFCSEKDEGVPDVISINGKDLSHSSLRIFGESPQKVTTNIIKIAERISDETL